MRVVCSATCLHTFHVDCGVFMCPTQCPTPCPVLQCNEISFPVSLSSVCSHTPKCQVLYWCCVGAVPVLCRCCAGAVPVLFHTRCARAMVCRGRLVSLVPHLTLHPCLCVQANHFLLPLWNLATNNLPDFLRNPMLLVMRSVSLAAVLCCTCLSRIKPAVCVLMRVDAWGAPQ